MVGKKAITLYKEQSWKAGLQNAVTDRQIDDAYI